MACADSVIKKSMAYLGMPAIIIKPKDEKNRGMAGTKSAMLFRKEIPDGATRRADDAPEAPGQRLNAVKTKNRARKHAAAGNHELRVTISSPRHNSVVTAMRSSWICPPDPADAPFAAVPQRHPQTRRSSSFRQSAKAPQTFSPLQWVAMPYTHVHNIMSAQEMMRLTTYSPIE